MDYLNYSNKVQKKPPALDKSWPRFDPHKIEGKVKPQGFGKVQQPQKTQLTQDDFNFGDLTQENASREAFNASPQSAAPQSASPQTSQQTSPQTPPKEDAVLSLFCTPVLISSYPKNYDKELEFICNQECNLDNHNPYLRKHYNKQSSDRFILDKQELSNIKSWIESKLDFFSTQVMGSNNKLVITQSWINKNAKGESHHEHKHPNSMFSGVWYPQINNQLPPIQFYTNHQRDITLSVVESNPFNSATFLLPLNKGELIIFPSNLQHSVPPNGTDTERISLSFNTWGKGNMGDIKSLTYLPFDRLV